MAEAIDVTTDAEMAYFHLLTPRIRVSWSSGLEALLSMICPIRCTSMGRVRNSP